MNIKRKLEAALELSGQAEKVEDDGELIAYLIPSSRGEGYLVTAYGGLLRCECPDYHYRKDPAGSYLCKHILAAIKKIEEEEIEEE